MKIIDGTFCENEYVTVEIGGDTITRKVRFKRDCGLYIMYKNRMYFYSEFEL